MPAYWLNEELVFPPPEWATEDGLVAVGGDASAERLVLAYTQGIFPWPHPGTPLLWFSPDPRFVLRPSAIHVPRSLRKSARKNADLTISMDRAFDEVVQACAEVERPEQAGTWITDELAAGYHDLHQTGIAHSVEAWRGASLVGGLYGVSLGKAFFGESMFTKEPDASKLSFVALAAQLVVWNFDLIDCQVRTDHLARFGAESWSRRRFLTELKQTIEHPTRIGAWELELDTHDALELFGNHRHTS